MSAPRKYEIVEGHTFQTGEKVFVVDENGSDLWEATIVSIEEGKYRVNYPEYEGEDETLEDTSRILVQTRKNINFFKRQESLREVSLESSSDDDDGEYDNPSSDEDDYRPTDPDNDSYKKPGKGKKNSPGKNRPKGARTNPRRG